MDNETCGDDKSAQRDTVVCLDHACHGHHDHAAHADLDTSDGRRRVAIACVITAVFMVVEAVGGILSGSLALLADAAHMFTDSASLALAWLGYWFASRAPDEAHPFGFGRMRVLAAFINGVALIALAVWIMFEGVTRLMQPQPIAGIVMLWVAIGGLVINLVAAYVLHGGDAKDINLSGALWHVLGDLAGSAAAIVAAVIIVATDWTPVDPLLSLLVAALVIYAGVKITQRAGHILLQGAPGTLTPAIIRSAILNSVDGLDAVHPIHVWQLTEDCPVVTVCICVQSDRGVGDIRQTVRQTLQNMGIQMLTIEIISGPADGVSTGGVEDSIHSRSCCSDPATLPDNLKELAAGG